MRRGLKTKERNHPYAAHRKEMLTQQKTKESEDIKRTNTLPRTEARQQ